MLNLSPRLMAVSSFVRKGSTVIDIGTDHAFLPAYLVQNNIVEKALACDLRKGPISNAQKTVNSLGLNDKIEMRLSDGLDNVKPDEGTDIIICGMGGTLISKILERADWIKDKKYRLILQPQSHSEDVRKFLCKNGFEIKEENVCEDSGHIYNMMYAEYTGEINEYPEYFFWFGKLFDIKNNISEKLILNLIEYLKMKQKFESEYGNTIESEKMLKIINDTEKIINEYND